MTWHYLLNDQTVGPVSDSELEALIHNGTLAPDVLVWRDGMSDWQPYGIAKTPVAAAPTPGLRIARHEPALAAESIQSVSNSAEPVAEIAPVGPRIAAKLIDVAFLAACLTVVVVFYQWIASLVQRSGGVEKFDKSLLRLVIRAAASALGIVSGIIMRNTRQAARKDTVKRSMGKRLMNLTIVDMAGRPLSTSGRFARSVIQLMMVAITFFVVLTPLLLVANRPSMPMRPPVYTPGRPPAFQPPPNRGARLLLPFVTAVVLSQSGYAVALFNRDRRGLHDWLCNTRVIASA